MRGDQIVYSLKHVMTDCTLKAVAIARFQQVHNGLMFLHQGIHPRGLAGG